jgi:hypothetical protein
MLNPILGGRPPWQPTDLTETFMTTAIPNKESHDTVQSDAADTSASSEKSTWETPTMEDVSEQVMAQPYIRFT